MLSDEKILVTGAAGQIALPLVEYLAPHNEVWGLARFSKPELRERIEGMGVTTRAIDLAQPDFSELPTDFTYLLHLAVFQSQGTDYDAAMAVNAEGTGLLLQPNLDIDGDLLGAVLPRRSIVAIGPGRGYVINDGAAELVQVARP